MCTYKPENPREIKNHTIMIWDRSRRHCGRIMDHPRVSPPLEQHRPRAGSGIGGSITGLEIHARMGEGPTAKKAYDGMRRGRWQRGKGKRQSITHAYFLQDMREPPSHSSATPCKHPNGGEPKRMGLTTGYSIVVGLQYALSSRGSCYTAQYVNR
jgi:hypothetical protein